MAFLEEFSQDDRVRLVTLPYRVGLWVSTSDSAGGHAADQQEVDALEVTITRIAQGLFESAFVHEVIAETFLNKSQWPQWSGNIAAVPDECLAAVHSLQGKLPQRDIDAYRHILMQVGLEVARAFREYDKGAPIGVRLLRGFSMMIDRLFGIIHGEKFVSDDILNISYEEDIALNKLAQVLRGDVEDGTKAVGVIVNS